MLESEKKDGSRPLCRFMAVFYYSLEGMLKSPQSGYYYFYLTHYLYCQPFSDSVFIASSLQMFASRVQTELQFFASEVLWCNDSYESCKYLQSLHIKVTYSTTKVTCYHSQHARIASRVKYNTRNSCSFGNQTIYSAELNFIYEKEVFFTHNTNTKQWIK